jgi:hypothetical protein
MASKTAKKKKKKSFLPLSFNFSSHKSKRSQAIVLIRTRKTDEFFHKFICWTEFLRAVKTRTKFEITVCTRYTEAVLVFTTEGGPGYGAKIVGSRAKISSLNQVYRSRTGSHY